MKSKSHERTSILAELSEQFSKAVNDVLSFLGLHSWAVNTKDQRGEGRQSEITKEDDARIFDYYEKTTAAMRDVETIGQKLAEALEGAGKDTLPVLEIVGCTKRNGGGPRRIAEIWPRVRASLERMKIASDGGAVAPSTTIIGEASKTPQRRTENARMLDAIQSNSESKGWTCTQWAEHLHCARSCVVETETWKQLSLLRGQAKAEKAMDRSRHRGRQIVDKIRTR